MRLSSIAFGAGYWLASGFALPAKLRLIASCSTCLEPSTRCGPIPDVRGLHGEQLSLQLTPAMDRLTVFGEHAGRHGRHRDRRYASHRLQALVLRAGHGTRVTERRSHLARRGGPFRDRAGPIALDIVAEVIFGVAAAARAGRCGAGNRLAGPGR